ncbi:MAG: hypothetical protein LC116_02320 [Bacteroidetes bacterium]|nr:hypothetical protein [Bacteroidota bacterium]MCZ2132022.1 hypothetical protein [Bacteroidota bacterium]
MADIMLKYIKYRIAEKRHLCFSYGTICKITISIRFSLLFIALLVPHFVVCAQISSNFTILDSLTRIAAERICAVAGNNTTITVKEHNAAWLLRTRLAESCTNFRLSQSDTASCVVGFTMFGIQYERLPDATDSLRRTCKVAVAGTYIRTDGISASLSSNMYSYRDTIGASDVATAEFGGYDFTRAAVPPAPSSLFYDIIEPFTIITTAALTVLLLFSVRSQ